jgi:hypothetical protein
MSGIQYNMTKKNKRSNRATKRAVPPLAAHPPPLQSTITIRKTQRFQATANLGVSGQAITFQNLGDVLLFASTASQGWQLAHSLILRRVRIWGAISSSLQPVTVSVEFAIQSTVGVNSDSLRYTDTSIGATYPSFLDIRPPKQSAASMWRYSSDSEVLMTIYCPVNSLVDVEWEIKMHDDAGAQTVNTTLAAAATPGVFYTRGLDGNTAAATNLIPIGVSNVI